MNDDEFGLMGLDGVGGELMGERGAGGYISEQQELFYNKLGEYNSYWMDLEGLSYKCSGIGKFNFIKHVEQMTEVPELQYYKMAISRNGGPIAIMLREKTFFFGKKDDTKNFIFIFSSYGKLIQTVNVSIIQKI